MSEEMAVTDKASSEEPKLNGVEATAASATSAGDASVESSDQPSEPISGPASQSEDAETKNEDPDDGHGRKRRASSAFSDPEANEDFRGFDQSNLDDSTANYSRVLERIEAEVVAESVNLTPVRSVAVTPSAIARAQRKRLRQDTGTDGSRPSSALSHRSDGDNVASSTDVASSAASSPAHRGRRATVEMSSPLLRVPLDRGWRRELVYRAALDSHSRRNADIYYYTPKGKKLRSTREVSEHLSGTGLTLENFSFFKEPLGVDDPEKEIIRDAKLMRRVDSPVSTPTQTAVTEGKRAHKPKPPKGASPEPATPKSPPAKIRVKSLGSRLSNNNATPNTTPKQKKAQTAANSADNNNTAAWKKPGGYNILTMGGRRSGPSHPATPAPPAAPRTPPAPPRRAQPPPPPLLQPRPNPPVIEDSPQSLQPPCSMSCGAGGVPSVACGLCLCLYHPACVGLHSRPNQPFLCKNCRKSPVQEPPPLMHKSGSTQPPPEKAPEKRVLLRMKVSGSGDGSRVWSVSPAPAPARPAPRAARPPPPPRAAPAPPAPLPQSIALLNGRRFIVVPRSLVAQPHHPEGKAVSRVSNGPGAAVASPRRARARKQDDVDYFTPFCNSGKQHIVLQIFQYLGMRDVARASRVCSQWRSMCSHPDLWRHVRMKNSHVSDWAGLCAALQRHGTRRLDLRKMLLPPNDAHFWDSFAEHIGTVHTLERLELCRCPSSAVEAVARTCPSLVSLTAAALREDILDPEPLQHLVNLKELRIKSLAGLSLKSDLQPLAHLKKLTHLSLTSIKDLGCSACEVVGELKDLVSLELGECSFKASFADVLSNLKKLQRVRLERGPAVCEASTLLRALSQLPTLHHLELINVDVKVGFDDALAECRNIKRLLIIPTYVSQSATTNKQVLSGLLRLSDTLTHLMWGVTIELLRVTELFIDQQCDPGADTMRELGECIPVLKPVPGVRLPEQRHQVHGPPQVEILPLPTLQRLLLAQMPHTKMKLLRIPFHATWRQSLADFQ